MRKRKQNCVWRGTGFSAEQQYLLYTITYHLHHYISPFDEEDADWPKAVATLWLAPAGSGGLLASLSASVASSTSFWLRKLGWLVDDSNLAHIRSVILTLFRVDVTLYQQEKILIILKSCSP
jgi:hypothetical protein